MLQNYEYDFVKGILCCSNNFSMLENKYWKMNANVDKRFTMYVSYVDISWHFPHHVCMSFCPRSLWMTPREADKRLNML